jgi:hypothetical protein
MQFLFFILFGPFVVVVQFASFFLLCIRLFSYINTRLTEILTEVSFPARGSPMTPPSLRSEFPSAKPHLSRISSFQVTSSKLTPRHSHASAMSTFRSQVFCVCPTDLTQHVNKNPKSLLSSGFISHLRLRISSLIDFHDDLCDVVRSINSAYSLQILVNVAEAFVCITVSLFCSYFIPSRGNRGKILHVLMLLIYCGLVKLMVILGACTTCTEEVSKIYGPG